jgi:DNA-binding NarL/FixJ family response regulator
MAAGLPEAASPEGDPTASTQPQPVRVLIVDDQEAFRSAARLVVEMTDGFETVGEAADGAAALEMARALEPQLVLLDMRLPVLDGVEVTRRLSRDHPGIRVLALSTHEEYGPGALRAGAVAFVTKAAFGPDAVLAAWRSS